MRLDRLVRVYICQITNCWKSHVAAQIYVRLLKRLCSKSMVKIVQRRKLMETIGNLKVYQAIKIDLLIFREIDVTFITLRDFA